MVNYTRPAKRARRLGLVLVAAVGALFVAEVGLRLAGFRPWRNATIDASEPTMYAPDPVLGWVQREGDFRVPPYEAEGSEMRYGFLPGGIRRTRAGPAPNHETHASIVAVGGSFVQGWALSDEETMPWKLQERFQSRAVLNLGTGGYGTYQSLLALERALPSMADPTVVVYGFIEHHEVRNVAPPNWVAHLARYSSRGHVAVPFVTLGDSGGLVRHEPARHERWPLGQRLVLVSITQRAVARIRSAGRMRQRREVTEALLLEMRDVTRAHGAELVVAMLVCGEEGRRHYETFLNGAGVTVADCAIPSIPESMRVKGEGHPNADLAARWAACIGDAIDVKVD
jgi:hypothetical protein